MKPRQAYYILDPEIDTKQEGDECWNEVTATWGPVNTESPIYASSVYRRPVPETQDDGWIPWGGGICPVDLCCTVEYRLRNGKTYERIANSLSWQHAGTHARNCWDIIAYRIVKPAPEPEYAPLGPEDVPPGSVLRGAGEVGYEGWCLITSCSLTGIRLWHHCDTNQTETKWETLMESDSEIKRPGEDWQPCKKLK